MSTDLSERSLGECGVEEALVEVRACRAELRTYLDSLREQLAELANELQEWGLADQHVRQATGGGALDEQIERLAELTNEFAESLGQLKNKSVKSKPS